MNRRTKEIINKIEIILLDGKKFDKARKKILLDNSNSFQVQACPGSGKTTLLVAKLMFLAQTIDFSKESICILTHTNVAVDEIRKKIKKHNKTGYEDFINKVYKLFDYPNYVGTIQSFLDKYLGIPGYIKKYGFKPIVIDDDRKKFFLERGFYGLTNNTQKYLKIVPPEKKGMKPGFDNEKGKKIVKSIDFNIIDNSLVFNEYLNLKDPTNDKYKELLNLKREQIEDKKILGFKEIDYFSLKYLQESKNIKCLLQKRFKYVFLDEIQDTHSLHVEILNKLYNGNTNNIIQGFGDYNQEVFNNDLDEKKDFEIFSETKQINNSLRLSSVIAENVKNVCVKPQELKGVELKGKDGENIKIPIYFIIFDNPEEVISKYLAIIEKHKDSFIGIKEEDLIFKAVGWIGKDKENGKFNIGSYRNKYNNGKITKSKVNLYAYFQKVDENEFKNKGYLIYKDNIINGILHTLNQNRDHQILYKYIDKKDGIEKEKHFSKTTFIDYLKKNDLYNEFQEKVFVFSNNIQEGTLNWNEVKNYILNLEINGKKVKDDSFLKNDNFGTPEKLSNISTDNKNTENIIQIGEIKTHIQFATIAKVKGETHTGTLVLDTDYKKETSVRILEHWKNDKEYTKGGDIAKSLKNYYVAITRTTHLLCISIRNNSNNIDLIDNICDTKNIIKI